MGIRELSNRTTSYQTNLRNRQIDYNGVIATIYKPSQEDEFDELGGRKTFTRTAESIKCIPKYESYYQILNLIGGSSVEDNLPLEVYIRTDVEVPNDTILEIPLNTKDNNLINYKWRVLSVELKHLETYYAKILKCVAARS